MKKTIKGKKIPHLVEPQFYNMEFDSAEIEEMQAIHDANPKNLKFSPKKEAELKEMFSKAVKETKEKKAISIRLSNADINGVKKIAEREWIPYQTLIASIVHKIATGKIKFQVISE